MTSPVDLADLYQHATEALKTRDYDRAADLLRRILVVDENYRDASRLLAQAIRIRRRKWYADSRLWGALIAAGLLVAGILLAPRLRLAFTIQSPAFASPVGPLAGAAPSPALTLVPAPPQIRTALPLRWRRVSMPQQWTEPDVRAVAVDPTDPEVIYAGTQDGGIYKTIDGGMTWQPSHSGLGRASIFALLIDPQNAHTVYAATAAGGVYKSTDGGASWSAANAGLVFGGEPRMLALDPRDAHHLYYADQGRGARMYESRDGGTHWAEVASDSRCPDRYHAMAVSPADFNVLYISDWDSDNDAECPSGLYQSADGGRTWALTSLKTGGLHNNLWVNAVSGTIIFARVRDGHMYRSADAGETWERVDVDCESMWLDPGSSAVALCGTHSGVEKSIDGGQTWADLGLRDALPGRPMVFIRSLAVSPMNGGTLLAGGDGLYASDAATGEWLPRIAGLGGKTIQLKVDPSQPSALYGWGYSLWRGSGPLYQSKDGGETWNLLTEEGWGLSLGSEGQALFRAAQSAVMRSTDQGTTWERIDAPVADVRPAVSADPRVADTLFIFYAREDDPYGYFSTDGGASWTRLVGTQDMYFTELFFQASVPAGSTHAEPAEPPIASGRSDYGESIEGLIYAADYYGLISRSQGDGQLWESCTDVGRQLSLADERLVIDPRDPAHIFVATVGSGVLTSTDGCDSWHPANAGLTNLFVNTLAIDPGNPDVIYAATDGGAHVSYDNGASWNLINDGLLGATVVYSIVVDAESNVYAATPYGIFRLEGK